MVDLKVLTGRFAAAVLVLMFACAGAAAQSSGQLTVERCMTPDQFRAAGLSKLTTSEMQALNAWFALTVDRAIAIGQNSQAKVAGRNTDNITIDDILGGVIIAPDGQFLGIISNNLIDPKSISNSVGQHGSSVGQFSIFNTVCKYGGTIGRYSPFNNASNECPQIYVNAKPICYLTVNTWMSPRFDPRMLKASLESRH
ncbi:hypothetical protein [Novipirellula rosea]|uniref:Uncharacterized protein n=1 Tax=Novipirellula rosea TaxID=1031540 RepID=A0ABP8M6V7_9BACT